MYCKTSIRQFTSNLLEFLLITQTKHAYYAFQNSHDYIIRSMAEYLGVAIKLSFDNILICYFNHVFIYINLRLTIWISLKGLIIYLLVNIQPPCICHQDTQLLGYHPLKQKWSIRRTIHYLFLINESHGILFHSYQQHIL